MNPKKILIVEDEVLIADGLRMDLEILGYTVLDPVCDSMEMVQATLLHQRPDLILLDIRLQGRKTGIDIAQWLVQHHPIPFIFVTSHLSPAILDAAKAVTPAAFITKPYAAQNLWANIELALRKPAAPLNTNKIPLHLSRGKRMADASELLYLEASGAYTQYAFDDKKVVERITLSEALDEIAEGNLLRIHRSFAINPRRITAFTGDRILIGAKEFPISRGKRKEIMDFLARR